MGEIFHRCRHLGIEMTREEYWAYLRECEKDDTKRIRTQIGRYIFNEHDICLNPDKETVSVQDGASGYYLTIKMAECGNGVWVYGLSYCCGSEGGCFGALWACRDSDRKRYDWAESEKECRLAALRKAVSYIGYRGNEPKRIKLLNKIAEKIKQLERPQVVELSLF